MATDEITELRAEVVMERSRADAGWARAESAERALAESQAEVATLRAGVEGLHEMQVEIGVRPWCEADGKPWPCPTIALLAPSPAEATGALPILVGSPWTDEDQSEICHHCGQGPDPDGDHSCPCPNSDETCTEHPAPVSSGEAAQGGHG